MRELAEVWFTGFGVAVVFAVLLFGSVSGFVLRWLTKLSDFQILVGSGLLPIFLFVIFVFLTSFGHGALGIADYVNWTALIEFFVMFSVSFVGGGLGVRAYRSLCRFLLTMRSDESE